MKYHPATLAVAATIAFGAMDGLAVASTSALAAQAKLTLAQARTKALTALPGRVASYELERETGGSGLRYSFDIVTKAGTREVGIDAKTGAVLENRAEPAVSHGRSGKKSSGKD